MTLTEFEHQTFAFQNTLDRDLETYLLALLALVEAHKNKAATPELLLELLRSAFTATPAVLDPAWLRIISAPEPTTDPKIIPDLFAGRSFDGIDYTIAVLQFQVAELYKMRGRQLADEARSMGIDSETGNRWYNFDPKSNISCGLRYFSDAGDEEELFEVDWSTLGDLLEMGRMYE